MLENNTKTNLENINTSQDELDDKIDNTLANYTLDQSENEIVQKIINAPTKDELECQFNLFNVNLAKKNVLRLVKLKSLLGKVDDQLIDRFKNRPDQISNKELLDAMQVISNQIDVTENKIDAVNDKPMITAIQKNTKVNINIANQELDHESKERVVDVISELLKNITTAQKNAHSGENIIDVPGELSVENTLEDTQDLDLIDSKCETAESLVNDENTSSK